MELSDRLKQRREELNLTQPEYADALGLSASYYNKLERGILPCGNTTLSHLKAQEPALFGSTENPIEITMDEAIKRRDLNKPATSKRRVKRSLKLSAALATRRKKLKLSQKDYSERLGVSLSFYSSLELGYSKTSPQMTEQIKRNDPQLAALLDLTTEQVAPPKRVVTKEKILKDMTIPAALWNAGLQHHLAMEDALKISQIADIMKTKDYAEVIRSFVHLLRRQGD